VILLSGAFLFVRELLLSNSVRRKRLLGRMDDVSGGVLGRGGSGTQDVMQGRDRGSVGSRKSAVAPRLPGGNSRSLAEGIVADIERVPNVHWIRHASSRQCMVAPMAARSRRDEEE